MPEDSAKPNPPIFGTNFNSHPLENLQTNNSSETSETNPNEMPESKWDDTTPVPPLEIHHSGTPLHKTLKEEFHTPETIKVTHTDKYQKDDPPLIDVKVTNPVTYLKLWLGRLLRNEGIDFRFRVRPVTAIFIALTFAVAIGGTSFSIAKWYFLPVLVPTNLIAKTSYTGTLQRSNDQFILVTPNYQAYIIKNSSNEELSNFLDKNVFATGKVNKQSNTLDIIGISEIEKQSQEPQNIVPSTPPSTTNSDPIPEPIISTQLPPLYSGFQWANTEKKILVFTSGKRRIDIEGHHIESITLQNFPTEFMDYYKQQLITNGWKQTLEAQSPEEKTITYAKGEQYLTIGVETVFKGKGETKQLSGYKAYLEYN